MSMLRCLLLWVGLALASTSGAQNLVPNGSFEEYIACPPNFSFLDYAVGWRTEYLSPDFFHACHTGTAAGVPYNTCGYQYPASGQGYAGIITYDSGNPFVREVMSAELQAAVVPGIPIFLSMKVAVGGWGTWNGNSALFTTSGLGIKFVNSIPSGGQAWVDYLHPNEAAIYLEEVPTDTAIWYTVQGFYMPDSAYTHVIVGNFFADSLINPTIVDSSGFANTYYAYSFIDDICISYNPADCITVQGIVSRSAMPRMQVASTFTSELRIWFSEPPNGTLRVELFDAAGRTVWLTAAQAHSGSLSLSTPSLVDGIYLLRVSDESGAFNPVRINKQNH